MNFIESEGNTKTLDQVELPNDPSVEDFLGSESLASSVSQSQSDDSDYKLVANPNVTQDQDEIEEIQTPVKQISENQTTKSDDVDINDQSFLSLLNRSQAHQLQKQLLQQPRAMRMRKLKMWTNLGTPKTTNESFVVNCTNKIIYQAVGFSKYSILFILIIILSQLPTQMLHYRIKSKLISQSKSFPFEQLPSDIQITILYYLSHTELYRLSISSKYFNDLANKEIFWKNLCLKCIPEKGIRSLQFLLNSDIVTDFERTYKEHLQFHFIDQVLNVLKSPF